MARNYLLFLIVAGLLSSMLSRCGSAPDGKSNPHGFDAQVARHEADMARGYPETSEPSNPYDALELRRESNGHFYADVEINGTQVRMLVDTGASGIALSRDDAQRAGIAISAGMFDVVGEGASGAVRGEHVMIDRMALGGKTAEGLPAVVLDGGEQSLLGQSFLRRFRVVEIQGDKMLLR